MSQGNPYAPAVEPAIDNSGIRKVHVRPIELLKQSYALIGDQYWLFFGIVLVAIFVGSLVPFGLIMGPMMVGIYLCFLNRHRGSQVEFATLFKGFDYFVDSFVVVLLYTVLAILAMMPALIALFAIVLLPIFLAGLDNPGGVGEPQPNIVLGMIVFYPLVILASLAVFLPFTFAFQLIAEHNLKALDAIKVSARGTMKNLGGILWLYVVNGIISMLLTMMCYVPALFFMPIAFGSFFLVYRDIYPASVT